VTNAPARTGCLITGFSLSGRAATVNDGAGTVTISVPYGTDRSSLAPSITISGGAVVSPGSAVSVDFSSGAVQYTVTAEDGVTEKVYSVTVAEDAPSTECVLTFFSVDGREGVINESAGTVSVTVPAGTDVTALSTGAAFSAGASISPLTNTVQNFSTPKVYRVTAQDGTTFKEYTVTVTVLSAPPAYIIAFCPDYNSSFADGGACWIDIRVSDAAAFAALGAWKIKCGTTSHINLLMSSSDVSWTFVNGDTIRVHQNSWTKSTDSLKSENNSDKWDYKSGSAYFIYYKASIIWIEDGAGSIVDLVSYQTANASSSDWLSSSGDNPLAVLSTAVGNGQWSGTAFTDAFAMGATIDVYARLKDTGTDGDLPVHWMADDGNESDPPTVSIVSPAAGAGLTSSVITVSGTAADIGVGASGVKEVWVKLDSGSEIKATGTTSWTVSLVGAGDGAHTITAYSKDNSGNDSTLATVSVTVTLPPDTTNPTVNIAEPTVGEHVQAGSLKVSGTAADPGTEPSGVSQVWVRVDSGSWMQATGAETWTINITNVADGSRTVSVYSIDRKGNISTTQSVAFTYTYVSSPYPYIVNGKFQPQSGDPHYSYYSSAAGLTGTALLNKLHDIIKGHTDRGYNGLYTIYHNSDNTSDGKVWDMYSDRDGTGLNRPYTFTHFTSKCGTYSHEGDCYNREHVVPQSKFNRRAPMRNDAHHVIPSDGKVNGIRSAYPHGDVSSATKTTQNGSQLGPCANAGYSGTVFEPIDAYKGDIARLYLYFSVRYRGNSSCGSWAAMNS